MSKDETGNLVAPESANKVDLVAAVLYGDARVQAAHGVSQVEVTVRDGDNTPLYVLSGSGGYNPEGITVYPELNAFFLPRDLAVSGTKGDIRVWYSDGKEEMSSLKDGHDLITYFSSEATPPFRRSGLPSVNRDGKLVLPYEAEPWRKVLVERSTNLADPTSWKALSGITFIPPIAPAGVKSVYGTTTVRTALLPMDGNFAVYRLRDEESVTAQKQ